MTELTSSQAREQKTWINIKTFKCINTYFHQLPYYSYTHFFLPFSVFCSHITEHNDLICPTQIIKHSLQDTGNFISLSSFSCQMNRFNLFRGVVLTNQRAEYVISHSPGMFGLRRSKDSCVIGFEVKAHYHLKLTTGPLLNQLKSTFMFLYPAEKKAISKRKICFI